MSLDNHNEEYVYYYYYDNYEMDNSFIHSFNTKIN